MIITCHPGYPDAIGKVVADCPTNCKVIVTAYYWDFTGKAPEAEVEIILGSGDRLRGTTDENGVISFSISSVPEGDVEFALAAASKTVKIPHVSRSLGYPADAHTTSKLALTVKGYTVIHTAVLCAPPQVAVVGGGAAGITAAADLLEKGYKVVLIEAGDALGGRARTDTSLGVPFDHGCQWLHHDLWQKEAAKIGVVVPVADEELTEFLYTDGVFSSRAMEDVISFRAMIEECFEGAEGDELASAILERLLPAEVEKYVESRAEFLKQNLDEMADKQTAVTLASEQEERMRTAREHFHDASLEAPSEEIRAAAVGDIFDAVKESVLPVERRKLRVNIAEAVQKDLRNAYAGFKAPGPDLQRLTERAAGGYAERLKEQRQAQLRQAARKWVAQRLEEEVAHLRERIDRVLLPLAVAQLGAFEESIEFEHFSIGDLSQQDEHDIGYNNCQKIPEGGYGTLIRRCGEGLKERFPQTLTLHLNTAVTAIGHEGAAPAKLTTIGVNEAGYSGQVEASGVIVTASTAVLAAGGIGFDPPIPGTINDFRKLPLGHYKKIAIRFRCDIFADWIARQPSPPFDGEEQYPPGEPPKYYRDFVTYFRDTRDRGFWKVLMQLPGSSVVVLIAAGSFAQELDALDPHLAVEQALEQLRAMLGEATVDENFEDSPANYSVTRWSRDPYVLGAYSYTTSGAEGVRDRLKNLCISGRLFFAGEALWKHCYGTAQAALLSGRHAAALAHGKLAALL